MEALATPPPRTANERHRRLGLLVADPDRPTRALLASCAREAADGIVVLEAEDGAEAIQLGLQRRPDIALLDVDLPRLGGIEVATTLRELQPRLRLALQTADPLAHQERARTSRLPLLGKTDLDHTRSWLRAQVEWCRETRSGPRVRQKHNFACAVCGYGVFRPAPPERCPMCQSDGWVRARRPLRTRLEVAG